MCQWQKPSKEKTGLLPRYPGCTSTHIAPNLWGEGSRKTGGNCGREEGEGQEGENPVTAALQPALPGVAAHADGWQAARRALF